MPRRRVPPVTVRDLEGQPVGLPDRALPLLIFYEDKDAAAQNRTAREVLGAYVDRLENRTIFRFLAVGDVGDWDFWPARRYVLAAVRRQSREEGTPILLDWSGEVRTAWGLTRGRSCILLVAPDGEVRFHGEGPLTEAQLAEVVALLVELGAQPK